MTSARASRTACRPTASITTSCGMPETSLRSLQKPLIFGLELPREAIFQLRGAVFQHEPLAMGLVPRPKSLL